MSNQDRIAELKRELEVAERDAQPVIVECTERTKDRVVFEDRTHGTTRVNLLGGEPQQYYERPQVKEEIPLVEKAVDPTVGRVVSQNERQRVIELVSGTKRVDLR